MMSITRRTAITALAAMTLPAPGVSVRAQSRRSAYAFYFTKPDGNSLLLADYAGKPVLIVNTATQCGFAGQYRGLQELWTRYKARGLLVVAVPSNDFGGQEPLADGDIAASAHHKFGVDFPMVSKTSVSGEKAHPFYRWAAAERPLDAPRWNFHKYLVGAKGDLAGAFSTRIDPMDAGVVAAVERELKAA